MAKKADQIKAPKAPKAEPKAPKALKLTSKAPKAPKAEPKAPKQEAPKAEPKAPKQEAPKALAIHVNKTGRVCFSKEAALRLGGLEAIDKHMALEIDNGVVRIDIAPAGPSTLPIRNGGGRPYISATRQFKPLGFDGSQSLDIEAKPYGTAGFEFKLIA